MEEATLEASHRLKPTSRFRFPIDTRKSNESRERTHGSFETPPPFPPPLLPIQRSERSGKRHVWRASLPLVTPRRPCHLSLENNRPSSSRGERERENDGRTRKRGTESNGAGCERERSQREGRNYVIAVSLRSANSITQRSW